ncbi:winged helix-turn-helix domain-containing protein [Curtobacterium sp. 24E2]|nr:winged helix-turn-helix domain-containing protein [Curtobacterium sp. 24E2]
MTVPPRIAVLGPVTVTGADGRQSPVPGALARAFLTALVLARGHALTTESLIDDLWPDAQPRGARAALQTLVSRLRRSVADGLVVSTSTGYALGGDPEDVDLARAARAVGETEPAAVRAALDLWRGDPGADVDGDLGAALADRAAALRRTLRRALGGALLDAGDADEAAALWAAEAVANPYDEVAVAGSMRALAAAGRTSEAIAAFAAHRDRLADELGADPSADLVRLNAELLRRSGPATGSVRRVGLRAAPNTLVGRRPTSPPSRTCCPPDGWSRSSERVGWGRPAWRRRSPPACRRHRASSWSNSRRSPRPTTSCRPSARCSASPSSAPPDRSGTPSRPTCAPGSCGRSPTGRPCSSWTTASTWWPRSPPSPRTCSRPCPPCGS